MRLRFVLYGFVCVVVVLMLAGCDAADKALASAHSSAQPPSSQTLDVSQGVLDEVDLDPFVVNITDNQGKSMVRVKMVLVLPREAAQLLNSGGSIARVRATILDVLSSQDGATLLTPAGKMELKKQIIEHLWAPSNPEQYLVTEILFTEFVIDFGQ